MLKIRILLSVLCLVAFLVGCSTIPKSTITAGEAQRKLNIGESTKADVLKALGSPNIHYKKKDGSEMWTYESVTATQYEMHVSLAGGAAGIIGTAATLGGLSGGGSQSGSMARTLTIMVYFDSEGVVTDFETMETHF